MYSRLHLSTLSNMEPVHLDEFYAKSKQPGPDFKAFGEEHIQMLLKVCAFPDRVRTVFEGWKVWGKTG